MAFSALPSLRLAVSDECFRHDRTSVVTCSKPSGKSQSAGRKFGWNQSFGVGLSISSNAMNYFCTNPRLQEEQILTEGGETRQESASSLSLPASETRGMQSNNGVSFSFPFEFSAERGFLPLKDPVRRLSSPEYAAWEDTLEELPSLLVALKGEKLQKHLMDRLPEFSLGPLLSEGDREQIWRAMLVLSFISHAYVWSDASNPPASLPMKLSLPSSEVSRVLDMPPILVYATYNLLNWRRLDPIKPIELENIVCLHNFYGGVDEEWFRLVHIDIEAKAGIAVQSIFDAQFAVSENNATKVGDCLGVMSSTLEQMQQTLERMREKCDPYVYYHRIRSFMSGWRDNPALPEGMLYEGVDVKQRSYYGETGAQSSIVPAFDAALGVIHQSGWLSDYLQVMRLHMPVSHRLVLQQIENGPSIREFVILHFSEIAERYDACLLELFRFRNLHKSFAHAYIQKHSPREVGTGGTDFMPYLTAHATTTKTHFIGNNMP